MASFAAAIMRTMQNEGGYVNDPADPGGETKYGISKRVYPDIDIESLTFNEAQEIYRRDYWQKLGLDDIADQDLAEQVFDHGVNAGTTRAARMLQDAYNLVTKVNGIRPDAIIGPVTIAAVNTCKFPADLVAIYKGMRFYHYYTLVKFDLGKEKFFKGWVRRIGI